MPLLSFRFVSALLIAVLLAVLAACHSGVYHTVEPGQNLFRISRTYGVDSDYLARINNISDPTQLRAGTRLFIPGADRTRKVAVVTPPPEPVAPTPAPPKPAPPPAATPSAPRQPPVTAGSPSPSTPAPVRTSPSVTAAVPTQKFLWPLNGTVVRSYTANAEPGRGRGIEIAARAGTPVIAAEAGRVIYSGDGVSGYGYLVILEHADQIFTVYGFNQQNLVQQGNFVSRGDRIALSGTPPSGGEPRLHFEVRRGKDPVDPRSYLP